MRMHGFRPDWIGTFSLVCLLIITAVPAWAQDEGPPRRAAPTSGKPAWFGLPLPPKPGIDSRGGRGHARAAAGDAAAG